MHATALEASATAQQTDLDWLINNPKLRREGCYTQTIPGDKGYSTSDRGWYDLQVHLLFPMFSSFILLLCFHCFPLSFSLSLNIRGAAAVGTTAVGLAAVLVHPSRRLHKTLRHGAPGAVCCFWK